MRSCPPFAELNALIDGDLDSEAELEVRRHLDLCAACRRTVAAITALKQAVGRAYASETPPPALRRAVVARSRTRRVKWHWWAGAIAAMLLAVVGALVVAGDHPSAVSALATSLVADHVHSLSEPYFLETSTADPEELNRWFQDRLTYPVTMRALPDSRLLGGRRRTIFGHPAAVASYEKNGDRISLFMTNAAIAAAGHPVRKSFDAVSSRRCRTMGAYRVCLHREGDLLVGIVAPERAGPEQLLPVADQF
jgi:anti-sigma factor RsiW